MKRISRAKCRDANERSIVDLLKAIGATVIRLDEFDLLVGYHGMDFKFEVKTENGRTTENQKNMLDNWRGSPLYVVRSADEAISIMNREMRKK